MALALARVGLLQGGLLLTLLAAAGCQGPTVLPPSGNHPPTSPESIVLYQKQPSKYERLGVVETSRPPEWGDWADMSVTIDDLRGKAAAMGANGLLLSVDGGTGVMATGNFRNEPYQIPVDRVPPKKAFGTAIFVLGK